MSLQLLSSYHAVSVGGLTVPFGASGGTPPYTFSVVPGGAGGSINPSTGLYTSANTVGSDVIEVTDSVLATATQSVFCGTPIDLVCDIIQTSMNLAPDQVYLWDQKIDIPTDSRLYVIVGVQSAKPFGNLPKYQGGSSSFVGVQSINMLATLSVDILSRSTLALYQKEQVVMSFSSPYAQAQMELNSFFLAPLTTNFVNLSQIDGAAIPYRFNMLVNLQYFSTLTTPVSYYDVYSPVSVTEQD